MHVFCNSGQGAAEHRLISALASFDDDDDDDDEQLAVFTCSVSVCLVCFYIYLSVKLYSAAEHRLISALASLDDDDDDDEWLYLPVVYRCA